MHARKLVWGVLLAAVPAIWGCAEGTARQVSASGRGAYEVSVAVRNDGFILSWYDTRDGNPEIYARVLDAEGRPEREAWRLTKGPGLSYEPDVAIAGDGFAVAWYEVTDTASLARLGMWDAKGNRRWEQTVAAMGGNARNPVLVSSESALFVAWLEHDGNEWAVWARWVDVEGRPLSSPVRVSQASDTTWNLNAAIDPEGVPWVVFDAATEDGASEVFAVQVSDTDARVVQLTRDDSIDSTYPDIAFGADRAAVTWFDERDGNPEVYLAALPYEHLDEEAGDGLADYAVRVTRTPGESVGAYVTWNGAQIGLAWSDDTEGSHEIYFQRFTADGAVMHTPLRVTTNRTASLVPAIEAFGDGFALAWNEDVVASRGSHTEGGRSEIAFALVP